MCVQLSLQLRYALACAALLLSIACDSDSTSEPQPATDPDASASRDGEVASEKPRTLQKAEARTKREAARDGGSSEPERDAAAAKPKPDASVEVSERDAAAPGTDASRGNPIGPVDELDAGVELDAATADGGEPDASLAPLQASIQRVELSGSLCPEDTYQVRVSDDLAALTVAFSAAELQSDVAQSLDQDCDVSLALDVPDGFQVGKISVQPTGYVFTEQGSGSVELTHAFPTSDASRTFSHPNLSGDLSWQFDDSAEDLWSPTCAPDSNRDVLFTIHVRTALQGVGYLNINAIDLDLAALRGVTAWRACEIAR